MNHDFSGSDLGGVMENPRPVTCPICGKDMRLTKVVPALAGLPELRTHQCPDCKEVTTVAVQREIPKS